MRRISFYNTNRRDNMLHIETEGCIVNIRVNLHDRNQRPVTSIEILPDKYKGGEWVLDGTANNRVINSTHKEVL